MKNLNIKKSGTRMSISILVIFFTFISIHESKAQFKPTQEIGIIGGTSYYIGDLNSTHFNNIQMGGGLTFRKNFDRRFTFKSSAIFSRIKGDDRNSSDQTKVNRNLHFKSDIMELSGQVEFNFLPYETGNPLYSWTPFVFAGVSLFHYNPKAEASDGQWYELQPLGTEGQGTTLPAKSHLKKYSLSQLSIPFGGGIKVAVNPNFNIIFEYGLRKVFTDYLDDVSTTYAGLPTEFDPITIELADRSLDGPKLEGEERGISTNNDWYSFSGITLSFTLQNNTKGCDY